MLFEGERLQLEPALKFAHSPNRKKILDEKNGFTLESAELLAPNPTFQLREAKVFKTRNLSVVLLAAIAVLTCAVMPRVDARPQAGGNMIYVPVTVTDAKGVPITTLTQEQFQLLEDNKEQKIEYFAGASEPMTLGIVMGLSARGPVQAVGQKDRTTIDITNAVNRVREAHTAPGPMAVDQMPLDSDGMFTYVTKGMESLSKQPSPKKAMVIVTDGLIASGSQATGVTAPKALMEASRTVDFPIHLLIVVTQLPPPVFTESSTYATGYYLQQVAELSGGEMVSGQIENNLARVSTDLRDVLKSEYVLGFHSPNTAKDGKWRKLSVKVNPPAGVAKPKVNAKDRYFVPKG